MALGAEQFLKVVLAAIPSPFVACGGVVADIHRPVTAAGQRLVRRIATRKYDQGEQEPHTCERVVRRERVSGLGFVLKDGHGVNFEIHRSGSLRVA